MLLEYEDNGFVFHQLMPPILPEILEYYAANKPNSLLLEEGQQFDPNTQYVKNKVLTTRPALTPTEGLLYQNVPAGTQLYVNNEFLGTIDDGVADFRTIEAGTFDIVLVPPFPHQTLSFTVTH